MKRELFVRSILAAAGILVAASVGFAKFPLFDYGHSSKRSGDIEILQTARIPGGPTLQSGKYRVVLNNDSTKPEVSFYRNSKLVAQVPAKLVDQGRKINETEVFLKTLPDHTQAITGMNLQGWKDEVLLGHNQGGNDSTK